MNNYRNGVGDWFVSDKKIELEKAQMELDAQKLQVMSNISNQPASGINKWIIIIPVAVLLIGGVAAFILLKRKKQ